MTSIFVIADINHEGILPQTEGFANIEEAVQHLKKFLQKGALNTKGIVEFRIGKREKLYEYCRRCESYKNQFSGFSACEECRS